MTSYKAVKPLVLSLVAIALIFAALLLVGAGDADPAAEDDAILTEGRGAHTLPGGEKRPSNQPSTGAMPQQESPLTGVAPLDDVADPIRPFSDLDLDQDGVLTPNEAHASPRIGDDWRRLDTNNDGVIDRSEMNLIVEQPPETAEEANR
ncbi:hypothetical protein [Halochromatium glycolicum]|uniref:EF-hand domain-containing protein n=1 Tax=Halochromatium glycolicum TaxID=85075 RepID=A0AAJ0X9X7_9GAMM|nr:hypothetical protein [Halochromatium glycolicum]MBK1705231.1 hypothetical protein [Halochromatium glycolicum]